VILLMTVLTVQDLIDRHKRKHECQYTNILVEDKTGRKSRYLYVSNLIYLGLGFISFDHIVDLEDILGTAPKYYHKHMEGRVIEYVEDHS